MLANFEINAYDVETVFDEKETLDYAYDAGTATRLFKGDIVLNSDSSSMQLEQYAFSNALSLSVKLALWEAALSKYIDSIEYLSRDLKEGFKIKLSESDVLKKTGELYSLKHNINLGSDLLDSPDFYWDREDLEHLFTHTCHALNVRKRTVVMNEKLNHCADLISLLNEYIKDKHHTKLEKIIIYLIMIEVGFEVIHYADRYFEKHEATNVAEVVANV